MARKLKKYSPELKHQAIQDYLFGHGSLRNICKKYGIKDKRQLRYWISYYNGHKEMRRPPGAKGEVYMTKGRKTMQEERAQIVAFCIEHGTDYALTVGTRQPVFHSDRGFQYTSKIFYNTGRFQNGFAV